MVRWEKMLQAAAVALLTMAPVAAIAQAAAQDKAPDEADEDFNPATLDLPRLIACDGYDVPGYNAFAMWMWDNAARAKSVGLTKEPSGNIMLSQYRLTSPITVFGRQTSTIVFSNSGPLAVFDEADPHPLAKQLGIDPAIDTPGKFMGEKVMAQSEKRFEDTEIIFRTRITLNVSTVTSHPGKTLAGCSYRIDTN
jgi:hypothetical protein